MFTQFIGLHARYLCTRHPAHENNGIFCTNRRIEGSYIIMEYTFYPNKSPPPVIFNSSRLQSFCDAKSTPSRLSVILFSSHLCDWLRCLNHGGAAVWAEWPTQNFGWVGHNHNAHNTTNNWPVCSLILRKISKIGATRCQILRLKCTKFAFRWDFARCQNPQGELTALPQIHNCI